MNTMGKLVKIKTLSIVILILIFQVCEVFAQQNLRLNAETDISLYNGELKPMWMHSNHWGIQSPSDKNSILIHLNGSYQFIKNEHFKLSGGLGGVIKSGNSDTFLHECFLRGKLYVIDFSIGKEAYSPIIYDDELTTGSFLWSSNARPIPRISVGIFEYLPLQFVNNRIEIKGGISQGWLNDDRGILGNSDVLLHEKFAYVRIGNLKVKPYGGLVHSALFGGTRPGGEKILVDFWATFFGKGSAKLGGGEETNVAGAHMGLFDFGADFNIRDYQGHFYLQKPFADGSGMRIDKEFFKDRIVGVVFKSTEKKKINAFSIEYLKTDWQSGPGTPDPYDPDNNSIVFVYDINDVEAYMQDRFLDVDANGWTNDDLSKFLSEQWNEGYRFGGRDDYMNNGMYYAGWTYQKQNMGTPLFYTNYQFEQISTDWRSRKRNLFVNNRIIGFNIGVSGYIGEFQYRLKYTYTKNLGAYGEEYKGRYSWVKTDNYYFDQVKSQSYTYLKINKQLRNLYNINLYANIACDFGDIYNSYGFGLGIIWNLY